MVAKFREKCRSAEQTLKKFKEADLKKKLKTQSMVTAGPKKSPEKMRVMSSSKPIKVEYDQEDEVTFEEIEYLDTSSVVARSPPPTPQHAVQEPAHTEIEFDEADIATVENFDSISIQGSVDEVFSEIIEECASNDDTMMEWPTENAAPKMETHVTVRRVRSKEAPIEKPLRQPKYKAFLNDIKVIINHKCEYCGAGNTILHAMLYYDFVT